MQEKNVFADKKVKKRLYIAFRVALPGGKNGENAVRNKKI